ncbi:MAG: phage/plasmid primase, P4 family [Candidatus Paceibacterota bacterium]|jgi:putative DNA primase/helicase
MDNDTISQEIMEQESAEDMVQQIEARVEQEAAERAGAGPGVGENQEITVDFINQCLFRNQLGDGELYAAVHRDRFLYNNKADEWYEWTGHSWLKDDMQRTLSAVEDVAMIYLDRAESLRDMAAKIAAGELEGDQKQVRDKSKEYYTRVKSLREERGRNACLKFARTCADPLAITGDEFDLDPMLLGVANGVVDLRTGMLLPGRQTDYISMASSIEFNDINEPCPLWDKTLLAIYNDNQDMVDYMRRLFGYAITGSTKERVFAAMWGQGWNGKGVIQNVIMKILDPLAGPIPSEMLLDQGKGRSAAGPSPDIMMLRGLRIAFASETDDGRRFSTSRVKWFTGADVLTGRYPHDKKPIRFKPQHTLFLLTNDKPHAPAGDFAFWERIQLINHPLSFVKRDPIAPNERKADLDLEKKLEAEHSGILAWLIRGCLEWQAEGLKPPEWVLDATAEYRAEEDLIGDFIAARLVVEPGARAKGADIYDLFTAWYQDVISKNPKSIPSNSWFGKQMGKRYHKHKIGGCVWYHGIGLPDMHTEEELPYEE